MRIPPMLSRRTRWLCVAASVFVLYAAGVTGATWLTMAWMAWLLYMLQQLKAHRRDYRERVAQRERDVAYWVRALRDPATGLQEREAAREMLAYLGVTRRQVDEAELRELYKLNPTREVIARRQVLIRRLAPTPPTSGSGVSSAAPPDVLRRTATQVTHERAQRVADEWVELRSGDGHVIRYLA
jgi:hypothetical protein